MKTDRFETMLVPLGVALILTLTLRRAAVR